ncbi:hypothetical protein Tco_1170797 [Tanacetum coccineum]
METHKPLLKDADGEDVDEHLYRSMIRSLMYLTSSRPDIMFAVCACVRFQVNPKSSHLYVVKRIFRYLQGQPKLGLWYPKDLPFNLVAYTDSDYAGASLDRKSTRDSLMEGCLEWNEKAAKDEIGVDEGLGDQEDASKQGRKIDDIDKDVEVTLVDETQGRYGDDLVFDTTILDGEEVFAGQNVVEKEVSIADLVTTASVEVSAASATPVSVATTTTTTAISKVDLTLAQALTELRSAKPKDKGKAKMIEPEKPFAELRSAKPKVVLQEPVQSTTTTTPSTIPKAKSITFRDPGESTTRTTLTPIPSNIKDKGKAKMI